MGVKLNINQRDDKMVITVLAENTAVNESFSCEHGLSLFIETKDMKILFDMGQSTLFIENAEKLGIDLKKTDIAVLSHGHYDHGGGLKAFLDINRTAPVYINRNAFGEYYNGTEKYIGLDPDIKNSSRIILTDDNYTINDRMSLSTLNKDISPDKIISGGLTVKNGNDFLPDPFSHEQYLEITDDGKRIAFSGCSHKGAINIAELLKPDVFIGGFHFSKYPLDGTLKKNAEALNSTGIAFFTCHCTGSEQAEFMKKYIPGLKYISTGEKIYLGGTI